MIIYMQENVLVFYIILKTKTNSDTNVSFNISLHLTSYIIIVHILSLWFYHELNIQFLGYKKKLDS